MSEEFNGWTNRETWALALHLDNTRELAAAWEAATGLGLEYASDFANEFPEYCSHGFNVASMVGVKVRGIVEDWRHDLANFDVDNPVAAMFLDVGSLWRVDWDEIAESKLDCFDVSLLIPKAASDLVRSERPLGDPVPTCPDCGIGAILWDDDDWHFCDWRTPWLAEAMTTDDFILEMFLASGAAHAD